MFGFGVVVNVHTVGSPRCIIHGLRSYTCHFGNGCSFGNDFPGKIVALDICFSHAYRVCPGSRSSFNRFYDSSVCIFDIDRNIHRIRIQVISERIVLTFFGCGKSVSKNITVCYGLFDNSWNRKGIFRYEVSGAILVN